MITYKIIIYNVCMYINHNFILFYCLNLNDLIIKLNFKLNLMFIHIECVIKHNILNLRNIILYY